MQAIQSIKTTIDQQNRKKYRNLEKESKIKGNYTLLSIGKSIKQQIISSL
jgi:hypothetical protein